MSGCVKATGGKKAKSLSKFQGSFPASCTTPALDHCALSIIFKQSGPVLSLSQYLKWGFAIGCTMVCNTQYMNRCIKVIDWRLAKWLGLCAPSRLSSGGRMLSMSISNHSRHARLPAMKQWSGGASEKRFTVCRHLCLHANAHECACVYMSSVCFSVCTNMPVCKHADKAQVQTCMCILVYCVGKWAYMSVCILVT